MMLFPIFGSDNFYKKNKQLLVNNPIVGDLILEFLKIENSKIIRISFNGNEGMHGDLYLIDSNNKKVGEFNFELIKTPNYASIDVSDLSKGTYTAVLKTEKGSHNAIIQIQ